MAFHNAPSPFLLLPRELRDEILGHLTLPEYVYISSATKDTHDMYLSRRAIEGTYVDTRIFLPSHPPANILVTCKQLRQECLEHHAYMFNVSSPSLSKDAEEKPMSNIVAERLGAEFAEEAERACDDGTLRITVEVQRPLRGPQGYFVPERNELSPRFLALLPLMNKTKKIRFAIWPGYDWWNGGPQPLTDKYGNIRPNTDQAKKPDAVSAAIGKILECLPQVEELSVDVLMQASDGVRWDLPDAKWENVQPWLDTSVTPNAGQTLRKVTRRLIGFCKVSEPEPFYTQHETRQDSGNAWKVERKGDMGTPTLLSFCDADSMEFIKSLAIQESFIRTD